MLRARVVSGSLTMALALRCACRLEQGAMLRVSAAAVEGEREQDLIGPDARHGSLVHRLGKDRRPLAGGQGPK